MSPLTYSVEEAGNVLGCKRRRVFQLLADGTLERAPRYGREIRIFASSVERALRPVAENGRKRRVTKPGGWDRSEIVLPWERKAS
jgi:excisionase family DNA binding protein